MPPQAANPNLDQQEADRQYYIRVLNEALELGLQRLRCLDQPDSETASPVSDLDAANIYERVTRSMRRSIMLADHLARDPAALTKPEQSARQPQGHDAEADAPAKPAGPRLEPRERLERLETLPDLPVPELVRLIYRDLDLPAPRPPPHPGRPAAAPSRPPAMPPFVPAAAIIAPRTPSRRIPDH